MKTHNFVDTDGTVVLSIEERAQNIVAFVGASNMIGQEVKLFVPTKNTDGVARAVVNGRIGVCKTNEGIRAARRSIVALHNRGIASVVVLHGFLVGKVVF